MAVQLPYFIAGDSGGLTGLLFGEEDGQRSTLTANGNTLTAHANAISAMNTTIQELAPELLTCQHDDSFLATNVIRFGVVGISSTLSYSAGVFTHTAAATGYYLISCTLAFVSGATSYTLAAFYTPSGGAATVVAQIQDYKSVAPVSDVTYCLQFALKMSQGDSFYLYTPSNPRPASAYNKGIMTILKV